MAKVAQINDDFEYLNEVSLIGRLSGVPIEKLLPSGDKVVEFRLVVGRAKNSSGKSKVSVDTIDVAVWGGEESQNSSKV